jgi:hypothetical protein
MEGENISTSLSSTKNRIAQHIYALKNMGLLVSIRSGMYYVVGGEKEKNISTETILDIHYWQIAKKIIRDTIGKSEYVIGGSKSLEIHIRDYSLPTQLVVYTQGITRRIRISDRYSIVFRTLHTGAKSGHKNMYNILSTYSQMTDIDGVSLRVCTPELAILDTLTIHDQETGILEDILRKYIHRYEKNIDRDILGKLVQMRYIRAVNRLREISKNYGYTHVYEICVDVIKKE